MSAETNKEFERERDAAFDKVIKLIERRTPPAFAVVILHLQEKSPEDLRATAGKDVWTLFLNGIRHLKNGAPDGQPGALSEALSRASLRASPFAAALGIRPPQFEPLYFSIDYTTGAEAALFLCNKLIEAAEGDFPKSHQAIQQKILTEKPAVPALKEQMALSFNILSETYAQACKDLQKTLLDL